MLSDTISGMINDMIKSYFQNNDYDYSKWEKEATEYGVDDVDEELLIKYVNE